MGEAEVGVSGTLNGKIVVEVDRVLHGAAGRVARVIGPHDNVFIVLERG